MTIHIVTGNSSGAIAPVAAAIALARADHGQRTLLFSFGPASSLAAVLQTSVGAEARETAPTELDRALDTRADFAALWEQHRAARPWQFAGNASDELPLLPGIDLLLGMLRLQEIAPRYAAAVVDAGPHEPLLRALSLPDSLRWGVRLLFGLERGPGRDPASVMRAVLPTSFMPTATRDGVQQARIDVEAARAALLDPQHTSTCFVLRPDEAALAEARLVVPALQLHGLRVARIVCGPLLPEDVADPRIQPIAEHEHAIYSAAALDWATRPVQPLPLAQATGLDGLRAPGMALQTELQATVPPIAFQHGGEPAVAIELPGLPRGAVQLTLSGDELIVQIGPYRRHVLLPDGLRGTPSIKATREGDVLIVKRRG
jgi:anion-transporting  ArsA/GET3 family ATPase